MIVAVAYAKEANVVSLAKSRSKVNWPTVGISVALAAVVSSLILAFGVIAMHLSAEQQLLKPEPANSEELALAVEQGVDNAISKHQAAPNARESNVPTMEDEPAPSKTVDPIFGISPPQQGDMPSGGAIVGNAPSGNPGSEIPTPSVAELNGIVHTLVATPASDDEKAALLEAGHAGVVVPRTVYTMGIFRAPNGWFEITGPVTVTGNRATAHLNSGSVGRPSISLDITFVYLGGRWKLASSSMCQGVKTVGLPIYCNA